MVESNVTIKIEPPTPPAEEETPLDDRDIAGIVIDDRDIAGIVSE